MRQARSALDALRPGDPGGAGRGGRLVWRAPLARASCWANTSASTTTTPPRPCAGSPIRQGPAGTATRFRRSPQQRRRRLVFTLPRAGRRDEWLLALREGIRHRGDRSPAGRPSASPPARPRCSTGSSGQDQPDIGEILGSSPRTVRQAPGTRLRQARRRKPYRCRVGGDGADRMGGGEGRAAD